MVLRYGMSDVVGPVYLGKKVDDEDGYGKESASGETLSTIEGEIKSLILKCKKFAEEIVLNNRNSLIIVAEALIKYETLSGQEIKDLVEGKEIRKDEIRGENVLVDSVSLLVKIMEENKNEDISEKEG
jgi:cell division protease FtsH